MRKKISHFFSLINFGVLLNIFSYGLTAAVGLSLNILIIHFYKESIFGVFSISYTIYIILSQISVFGVPSSVLYYTSENPENKLLLKKIFSSGLLLVSILSFLLVTLVFLGFKFFSVFYDDLSGLISLKYIVPGLLFFSINKLVSQFLNGLSNFNFYSYLIIMRAIFLFGSFIFFVIFINNPLALSAIFSVTELILMVVALIKVRNFLVFDFTWLKKHWAFGKSAFVGSFLMDLYLKIDLIILSVFVSDYYVGIYSFSGFFLEGIKQLGTIYRTFLNPYITRVFHVSNILFKKKFLKSHIVKSYVFLGFSGILFLVFFPFLYNMTGGEEFKITYTILTILIFGFVAQSGIEPFMQIFNQIGLPSVQSKYLLYVSITCIISNLLLIPFFGVYGAAFGTFFTFLFQILFFYYLKNHFLKSKSKVGA